MISNCNEEGIIAEWLHCPSCNRKLRQKIRSDTQVKHLRRAKDGPKGLVLPTHEKNLYIKLDEAKLRALEDMQTHGIQFVELNLNI